MSETSFTRWLIAQMRSHYLTSADLAERLGVSARDVIDWRIGHRTPTAQERRRLNALFDEGREATPPPTPETESSAEQSSP